MPGLAEQRLIISGLERATAVRSVRLIEAFRAVDPPVDAAMVVAGTTLIAVDLAPGIAAVAGYVFGDRQPGERRKRFLKIMLEAPLLVRSVRRLLP